MENVAAILKFLLLYALLLVWLPMKVTGTRPAPGKGAIAAFRMLAVSHTVLITLVYGLGLLGIYNRGTLWGAVALICLVGILIRQDLKKEGWRFLRVLAGLLDGSLKLHLLFRDWYGRKKEALAGRIRQVDGWKLCRMAPLYCVEGISLGILAARRFSLVWDNYAYSTSDMYVHQDWINYMEQNVIFYDGVYPFGMHNMLSSFHFLTGMNLNYVMRFWGPWGSVIAVLTLLFLMRRIFRSEAVVMVGTVIYCVTDLAGMAYAWRFAATLPQECGILFLFPCVYCLGKYLEEEQREHGVYFMLYASLMVSMHFYTAIFGALLCFFVVVVFWRKVFRLPMMRKLATWTALAAALSILPLVIGLMGGRYWQGSIGWALGVMGRGPAVVEEETVAAGGEESVLEPEAAPAVGMGKPFWQAFPARLAAAVEAQRAGMGTMWTNWLMLALGCWLVAAIFLFSSKRAEWRERMILAITLYTAAGLSMLHSSLFGLPELIQPIRTRIFLGLCIPVVLVIPIDLYFRLPAVWLRRMGYALSGLLAVGLYLRTYRLGYRPEQTYFYLQSSLAAKACVEIMEEQEPFTWTVVSPVDELSMIRNQGYHYELWEFITAMENYEEGGYLEIPTREIYFILEKKPLRYNAWRIAGRGYEDPEFTEDQALRKMGRKKLGIRSDEILHYYDVYENRCALEAKLYCWIQEYAKYRPEEMQLYMEDDTCAVYHLHQSEINWDNLYIPYGYNEGEIRSGRRG